MVDNKIKDLIKKTAQARAVMIETLVHAQSGHPGGALSSIDMMTALFSDFLRVNPDDPKDPERDRFILSKGHCSIALYTMLHLKGFIDREELMSFRSDWSNLGGHPDMHKVPGVEMSTGSLGHGLSVGVGMALAAKMDRKDYRTVVMMGDGEMQEGSIWEGAMAGSHFKLDNLTGIVDRNRIQTDGTTEECLSIEPLAHRWQAFGWEVRSIDGHNMEEIVVALRDIPFKKGKPSMIISNTVKGKGVSFMENQASWHGGPIKGELGEQAIRETRIDKEVTL